MDAFFQTGCKGLVASPNGRDWWHHMPLPDGTRVRGANPDEDYQFKKWATLGIPSAGGLAGRSVLDVGANDGFFTLAALSAGARTATAINSDDWDTYPHNIRFAADAWGLRPDVVTADFRTHPFGRRFDVIFFFGVLYHLEDVFGCMKRLRDLLEDQGTLYLETQMTKIRSDLPVFENASDLYPTTVPQGKKDLDRGGLSNYLLPNEHAVRNLAFSYDFEVEPLGGPLDRFTQENPHRRTFKLVKR
ncbi:MAG: DUF1698 domain-containing protein [Planctomycetia bacterium]|nr:DUF1698 domain-containing protein [Planctomycetia bacterium]